MSENTTLNKLGLCWNVSTINQDKCTVCCVLFSCILVFYCEISQHVSKLKDEKLVILSIRDCKSIRSWEVECLIENEMWRKVIYWLLFADIKICLLSREKRNLCIEITEAVNFMWSMIRWSLHSKLETVIIWLKLCVYEIGDRFWSTIYQEILLLSDLIAFWFELQIFTCTLYI